MELFPCETSAIEEDLKNCNTRHSSCISVECDTPKDNEEVVFTDGTYNYIGYYNVHRPSWTENSECMEIDDVTHWMPLPILL